MVKSIKLWETSSKDNTNHTNFEITLEDSFFQYIMESTPQFFFSDLLPYLNSSPMLIDLYVYLNYLAHKTSTEDQIKEVTIDNLYI